MPWLEEAEVCSTTVQGARRRRRAGAGRGAMGEQGKGDRRRRREGGDGRAAEATNSATPGPSEGEACRGGPDCGSALEVGFVADGSTVWFLKVQIVESPSTSFLKDLARQGHGRLTKKVA